ncbi:MAG: FAD:protein FMN transferase [Candidatus Micrarchaeota archaeon]|nr:FAD:protein FMN transferase [Candidatus Micrarchaeota archaeon]
MQLSARSEEHLGTVVEVKLPASSSSLFPACFAEFSRIEKAFSRFLPDSELSRLNSRLGVWQDATEELLLLVQKAEEFRAKTRGNFDITLKSRLEELGYGPKPAPSAKPSPLLGFFQPPFKLDTKKRRILLNKQIEFGGFGKGYAIDRVASILDKEKVKHYYINAGGDIFAKSADGEPGWQILLEHPDDPQKAIGKISLDCMAIAASAPNRRRWGNAHHLLNAKTGMPADGMKACFVLARTAIEADAYATALFSAGFSAAIELAASLPIDALLVSKDGKMYQTFGFKAEFFA